MTPLNCASCGHANRDSARFCAVCGDGLVPSCSFCGAAVEAGAQFCDACGAPVAGAREPPSGARRVVSVVFADLAGSTELQESLDAESVRRVMERFYEAMRSVVQSHGGQVAKFIGDAVVAVFGARGVGEHDALRAVRAAAAMVSDLAELGDEFERGWGVRLAMRTGVNTGELVVGEDQEILVGDTMNTAARLEQAAAAGEVLVGEATWRLVHHAVELESVPALELKGKAEVVRAWRLVSVAPRAGGDRASSSAPLVGREGELERLRGALEGAIAERACRLVSVIGSPGVGKTRLASEFAAAMHERARVVEGRCEPSGEGSTFLPVAEILRVLAGIGEADGPDAVRVKLGELVADDPERERLLERAAGVLGVGEAASGEETFWALRRYVESLGRDRPLVLVLDDLHWGQPMLLDLVEHMVEWVRDAAVLIVALARPELRETREVLTVPGRRAVDVIELDPLDQQQSRALVGELLGRVELPAALSERILETAEGNPLFLGEMLRMLVDEGALRREQEGWMATGDLADVEVPPTIQALLATRIERLRSEERSVIERASVIGKQFFRGAVAELVPGPVRAGIDGHLEALRRKDMVEPEGTYWIDEPVYRFHHVLLRDAAYRSLLKEARAELHERFADWLGVKAGELPGEHEEVIAFHLEQAHAYRRELGPLDERGRALGVRAAQRLHSAGRRALAREDLAAAANLLARALACETGGEEEILWDLAEAALSAGDTGTAAPIVARLAATGATDPRRRARAAVLAGQLATLTGAGQIAATVESVLAAVAELAELGDLVGEAKAQHVAAGAYVRLGQVGAVEEALDRALAAARAADDRRRITAVLAGAPRAALWGPSPVVRASGRCLDVVRILRMTPGNRHVEAIALRCQAVLEAMRGRAEPAREILAAGRTTLEELGLTLELHESAVHAGLIELLADDPAAAADHLRAARTGFEALGVSSGAAQAAALLARALVEQGGSDEEVLEQTRFAEEQGGEDLKTMITWCSARAEALVRCGETEHALALAQRAVSLAEPTDALADKADASMALARVLSSVGRDAEAREAAEAAGALYAAKGHTVGVAAAGELAGTRELTGSRRVVTASAAAANASVRVLGERPLERFWAELQRRANARDYEGMSELIAQDWSWLDHRALGWEEAHGREQCVAIMRSTFGASPDLRMEFNEVLACDERVISVLMAWRGRGVKAGEMEVQVGAVLVVQDGQWTSVDFYEPEDRAAMLARFTELGGRQERLAGHVPERFVAEFKRRFDAHDLDGLFELYAEDWLEVDHRKIGWGERRGRDAALEQLRSVFTSPDVRVEVDDVLACDERVIALRVTSRGTASEGGGEFELPLGIVEVIEAGRWKSADFYEHDDDAAMVARYAELGGGQGPLGNRPPERYYAEYVRRFATHDIEVLLELLSEDWVVVDHRTLGGEDVRGRDGAREVFQSVLAVSPDIRYEIDEVLACDERVIALRIAYRGHANESDGSGEFASIFGYVAAIEDGRAVSVDQYDHDDRESMIARYVELGGGLAALGDRAPERWWARYARLFAARELDPALALFAAEGCEFLDRRRFGWETGGQERAAAHLRTSWAGSTDIRVEVEEVLACDERVIALRLNWQGTTSKATGGGRFVLPVGAVSVIESGRAVRWEQFESEDREAMLARYAELGGGQRSLGELPPERYCTEVVRRFAARDLQALLELHAEDWTLVDHRALGWEEMRGLDGYREGMRSLFSMSPDIRVEIDDVLACDERVIATRLGYRGIGRQAGEFEFLIGNVTVVEGGRGVSVELYDYDDDAAMLARYAELGGRPEETDTATARL